MSVRTYNPSVRVGNWNEDLCLEEDLLKDFLEKKENGELMIHKTKNLSSRLLQPVALTQHSDGKVRFGDQVCLFNLALQENLAINMADSHMHEADHVQPCGVSSSAILHPCNRNVFVVSCIDDSAKEGDCLNYGQKFLICTLPGIGGDLKLTSDTATFMKNAKKSRLQEVSLVSNASYTSQWEILHFDPQQRMETEGMPVDANQKVMVNHCKTNQRLCALPDYGFRTAFGREHEIAAHTFLDSHKAEKLQNHFALIAYKNESD